MFRFDQRGISLPLVLAMLGIVVANTYYFMNVDKETKNQNIKRSSEVEDNSEKIRLISFLSDSSTCTRIFENQNVPYTSTAPLSKKTEVLTSPGTFNYINFLETGTLYARNSLKFVSYRIGLTDPTASSPPALEKRYSLFVTYTIMDRRPTVPVATLKNRVIRLPLNIVFKGTPPSASNQIKTCYTDPTNDGDTIANTVDSSCLGDGVLKVSGTPPECQHNQPDFSCPGGKVFTGLTNNSADGSFTFSCGKPVNAGGTTGTEQCSTTPIKTLLYEITNLDRFNCRSADNSCAQGDLLVMGAGGTHVCAKPCSAVTLFHSMNANGTPTCIAKPQSCPTNQYAKTIYDNGNVDCADYPILGKSCPAGKFATDIDPSKSNGDTAFKCVTLDKTKECPSPGVYTFVQSFTTPTPSCNTY